MPPPAAPARAEKAPLPEVLTLAKLLARRAAAVEHARTNKAPETKAPDL